MSVTERTFELQREPLSTGCVRTACSAEGGHLTVAPYSLFAAVWMWVLAIKRAAMRKPMPALCFMEDTLLGPIHLGAFLALHALKVVCSVCTGCTH